MTHRLVIAGGGGPLIFFYFWLMGVWLLILSLCNPDWFMEAAQMQQLVRRLTRNGVRLLLAVLGVIFFVLGFWGATGALFA